jgi:hypothetical protein
MQRNYKTLLFMICFARSVRSIWLAATDLQAVISGLRNYSILAHQETCGFSGAKVQTTLQMGAAAPGHAIKPEPRLPATP